MRGVGSNDETFPKWRVLSVNVRNVEGWMERIAGQRGCLMERVLSYSIICCPVVGNKDAEMLRCKVGVKE